MEVIKRREEAGAVVLLVAVMEGQQIDHGLVSSCTSFSDIYAKKNTNSN